MFLTMLLHSITTLTKYHPAAGSIIARHIIACSTIARLQIMLASMQMPNRCIEISMVCCEALCRHEQI